ncbi:TetR/AcrR family transcriptional regulator [Maridesulfovibrio sp.]|uniref:TetR/AcrR family transcriptional regulator n=1 Tax=Maridesulfovibrio sp. TaxID=2795000 RepID=UPI002A188AD5|nr:TetR/AcrR family transcriptional regulator [Maridesulfovibrio sp.]
MSKALDNYNRKQQQIVEAAKELFAGSGFAATSMDDVAVAAGVTKQTVYRYFPSKSDLFKATLQACTGQVPAKHVFGDGDISEELYGFAMRFLRFHVSAEYLDTIRLLMSEGRTEEDLGAIFFANGPQRSKDLLSAFLKEHIPEIRDTDQAAFIFVSMLLNVRMPLLLGLSKSVSEKELDKHARYAVDVFLNGCRPGGGPA